MPGCPCHEAIMTTPCHSLVTHHSDSQQIEMSSSGHAWPPRVSELLPPVNPRGSSTPGGSEPGGGDPPGGRRLCCPPLDLNILPCRGHLRNEKLHDGDATCACTRLECVFIPLTLSPRAFVTMYLPAKATTRASTEDFRLAAARQTKTGWAVCSSWMQFPKIGLLMPPDRLLTLGGANAASSPPPHELPTRVRS